MPSQLKACLIYNSKLRASVNKKKKKKKKKTDMKV